MEFEFETQIDGVKLKISLQTAALTEKDAVKSGVVRGYHCAKVAVNGISVDNPAFVSCYRDTYKKEGPEICFKFGAAQMMEKILGLEKQRMVYIPVPENAQAVYLSGLDALDKEAERIQEEAERQRTMNDQNVAPDDIIELSYTPRFVGVRYPKPSNREKEESRVWSQFDGHLDLDDWIEVHLEPYCVGLGCGSQKKYRIPYAEYIQLYNDYKVQLEQHA